jgi:integrase
MIRSKPCKYKKVVEFVKKYKELNTQRTYQRHLVNYFDWIGKQPEIYFKQKNNFQKDIENYYEKLYLDGVPPKSRKVSLASIKVFMIYNLPKYDERLPPSFWYKLTHGKYKGSSSVVSDKVPTVETLRKILMGANLRSKTLYMMLATSGMRISEALSLKWTDIDFRNNPVSITLSPEVTKTDEGRTVFITQEAVDVLIEWKNGQDVYAEKRKKSWVTHYDPEKVFSFTYQNALTMWWTLLKNSGFNTNKDKDHGRYVYHPHALRKFFRSRLAKVLAPDYIEYLMGHKTPRTKEYLYLPIEELGQEYLLGNDRLLIFQTPADTTDIRESLAEKDKQIQELQKQIDQINQDLLYKLAEKQLIGK